MAKKKMPDEQAKSKRVIKFDHLKPYQFKPGESGNARGRIARAVTLSAAVQKVGDEVIDRDGMTRLQALLRQMFVEALEGNQTTREMLFNRGWGTLVQKQMNFNAGAVLIQAAQEANLDANAIRSDPLLCAIFTACGVDPSSAESYAAISTTGTVIENDSVETDG